MVKPSPQADGRAPQPAQGPMAIAEGERFQILDDEVNSAAIITIANGQGKRYRLTTIKIERPRTKLGWKLVEYVVASCRGRIDLVPFVLNDRSTMKLAEYLYRSRSKSSSSMRDYAVSIRGFSEYAKSTPDGLVARCFDKEGVPDRKEIHGLSALIDEYTGELEAEERTLGTLAIMQARIKSFFRSNSIALEPLVRYRIVTKYRDRAPRSEELQRMIDVAGLREKAMIAVLATSGMRIGTLLRLKYRHVREDLEANRMPIHIHCEVEIMKGKYKDCDTFINDEAVHWLKLYIEGRRRGTEKILPEEITDDSPLFCVAKVKRDHDKAVLSISPITYNGVYSMMRSVFTRAGLTAKAGKFFDIRIHSVRKYFRTQLQTLGADPEVTESMMGHKISTYLDLESKGLDYIRGIYSAANLRIQQQQKASLKDLIREMIIARGEDPSRYLKEGIGPAMDIITPERETEIYAKAVWEILRKDVVEDLSRLNWRPEDLISAPEAQSGL